MKRAGPGWLLLALAGLASVFGAFLPFYTYAIGIDVTVWSRGLFPTAALIPLLGFAVGVEAVVVLVRGHEPRSPFLNFTWEQVRLAAGAFMILLSLSYLLQDRAGGSLGIGYALLAVSSLATFAGGILTRRAQLARAGEEAAAREARPVIGPAIATVSRASSNLARNVADRSRTMRERLAERREARAAARKEAAARAAAEKAAAERAAAERAAAEKAAAATAAVAPAAATEPAAAAEPVADDHEGQPPPPTTTVETLPDSQQPPAATMDELPAAAPAPEPIERTEPLEEPRPAASEPEDTAELPVAEAAPPTGDKTVEQPRATKLGTMHTEPETDDPPPDGAQSSDGDAAPAEPADGATGKKKESAESSSES